MLVLEGGDMGHKLSWRIILWAVIYGFFVVPREAACQLDGPHRQKKSLSCEDGETLIHAPAQFTNDQVCGDLVAAPPDYYNEVLLDECQRQLGLENRPSSVHGSSLVECVAFSNGTVRYRTDVCCPGSIAGLRCFTCSDGERQYDSLMSKYNADYCNYQGDVDTCAPDQVCLTHYNISRPINSVRYTVDKRCESAEVCEAAEKNNTASCVRGRWPSVSCSYCCNDSLCNYPSAWPSRSPGYPPTIQPTPNPHPCIPNPCYNGGTCSELLPSTTTAIYDTTLDDFTDKASDEQPGASSSNYYCTCKPGYNGTQCLTTQCSGQPCNNAGLCYTSSTPPYYYCRCKIGWNTSTDCVEAYPFCDDTKHGGYCQHNGTCYDHGEFGLRCSCPEGFHGSNCELNTGDMRQCTLPDAYYQYTAFQSATSYNCTEMSHRVQGYDRVSSCRSYVGSGFQQGVDGDMYDMFMEAIDNYFCERGDTTAFYKYHMCCPPCFRRPCKNGGWCVQTQTGYVCRCRLGYDGAQCQNTAPFCDDTKHSGYCLNNGICYDHGEFGLRCRCPEGFHGSNCELIAGDRHQCSMPDAYYRYTGLYSTMNNNCTEMSRIVQGYDRVSSCRSYVGSGFKQGLDGDMNDMFMEAIDNYFCERGDFRTFYKYHMCCPPCFRRPCKNGGWCVQTQAGYVCRCRLGYDGAQCQYRGATCLASGDPHFLTFDKRDVSFQGECKYNLVSSFGGADTEPFQVLTRNERRGSSEIVSYVRYVELHVYDHVVRLDRGNTVYVNDNAIDPIIGAVYADGKLSVRMNGQYVRVETDFGLVVENDGSWTAMVKLAGYLNRTTGLCGNNNEDPDDDFITSDGVDMTGHPNGSSIFGNSWQVLDPEVDLNSQCIGKVEPDPPGCPPEMDVIIQSPEYCGHLDSSYAQSSFQSCMEVTDIAMEHFHHSCRFDVCANQPDWHAMKEAACGSLQAAAAECANLGVAVNWRQAANCSANCTGGQEWVQNGPACPVTCWTPTAARDCPFPNTETCVCPGITVLNNGSCIDPLECGCRDDEGRHFQIGDIWLSEDCSTQFVCEFCDDCWNAFGAIRKSEHACPIDQQCFNGNCSDDACMSMPCVNGGSCTDLGDLGFQCHCLPEFTGPTCNQPARCDRNELSLKTHPYSDMEYIWIADEEEHVMCCAPGGTFRSDVCECVFAGGNTACKSYPCLNGGVCKEVGEDDFICECRAVTTGRLCELIVGCMHGADEFLSLEHDSTKYLWLTSTDQYEMSCADNLHFTLDTCKCDPRRARKQKRSDTMQLTAALQHPTGEITCITGALLGGVHTTNGFSIKTKGISGVNMKDNHPRAYFNGSANISLRHFINSYASLIEFSVSLWLKKDTSNANDDGVQFVVNNGGCYPDNPRGSFYIVITESGSITAGVRTGINSAVTALSSQITPGEWSHLVLSFDSRNKVLDLYVNNELQSMTLVTGDSLMNTPCPLTFGSAFTGYMAHVCLYQTALQRREVWNLFHTGSLLD